MTDTSADRSPKSRVDTVFAGEFKLLTYLGRGDVADRYAAELVDPPALVTVKIVYPELAADRSQVESLLREARAAAAIVHDNVAQVLDADISPEGEPYIVGEHVEGDALLGAAPHDQCAWRRQVAQRFQRALRAPLLHQRDGYDHDHGAEGHSHDHADSHPPAAANAHKESAEQKVAPEKPSEQTK